MGAQDEVKVLGRIGEGAFGEVSLATCAIFGKVAVKWLKVRGLGFHGGFMVAVRVMDGSCVVSSRSM